MIELRARSQTRREQATVQAISLPAGYHMLAMGPTLHSGTRRNHQCVDRRSTSTEHVVEKRRNSSMTISQADLLTEAGLAP